jgi:hypothetical protein
MKEENQEIKLLVRLKNSNVAEKKTLEIKIENASDKSNNKTKDTQTKSKSTTPTNKQADKKDNKKAQKNEPVITPAIESKEKINLKTLKIKLLKINFKKIK